MTITTIDPATGQPIATHEETSAAGVSVLLDRAREAAVRWAAVPPEGRAGSLRALAVALRSDAGALAALATREMGKPLAESRAEVEKCAVACDWFADHAPDLLRPEEVSTGARRTRLAHHPLGVVLAIMPWNFPYWQVVRALAPALAAGNGVVLKHAPSTTGCALALAGAAQRAGLPDGLFSVVVVSAERTDEVASGLIADRRIAGVTFTGSTRAGRAVAARAGQALKKCVLELGGSDPFVVLADADLESAAAWAARSRFQNAGQSCIAAKRIIVEEAIADAFTDELLGHVRELRVGDPSDPGVTVGPLARADLRDAVERQVRESERQGARVLIGGEVPDRPGFFYLPTVLDEVEPGMPVLEEEVFGPAVPILRARDAEHALGLANQTDYGLGSAVWTSDLDRGEVLALRLEAGHTAVNGMTISDPRLPFGGTKESGYGRELFRHGLLEFVNVHAIVVNGPHGPRRGPNDGQRVRGAK
ncbi:MAG TPA: aldehyde dehydrogenase family protein [Acidimicrobiales bacterium]|nr:aldehyde dehydrogenase family protein [Acidimicrobiales bacterium]